MAKAPRRARGRRADCVRGDRRETSPRGEARAWCAARRAAGYRDTSSGGPLFTKTTRVVNNARRGSDRRFLLPSGSARGARRATHLDVSRPPPSRWSRSWRSRSWRSRPPRARAVLRGRRRPDPDRRRFQQDRGEGRVHLLAGGVLRALVRPLQGARAGVVARRRRRSEGGGAPSSARWTATRTKALCDKYDVRGFPTLKGVRARPQGGHPPRTTARATRTASSPSSRTSSMAEARAARTIRSPLASPTPTCTICSTSTPPRLCPPPHPRGRRRDRRRSLVVDEPSPSSTSKAKGHVTFHHARAESDPGVARNFKLRDADLPSRSCLRAPNAQYRTLRLALVASALGEKASERIKTTKAFVDKGRTRQRRGRARRVTDAFVPAASQTPENGGRSPGGALRGKRRRGVFRLVPGHVRRARRGRERRGRVPGEHASWWSFRRSIRNDPFSFVWIDGGAQAEFARAFGLRKSHAPALVAVKTGKRNRFAVMGRGGTSPNASRARSSIRFWAGISSSSPSRVAERTSRSTSGRRGEDDEDDDVESAGTAVASRCTAARTSAGRTSEDAETEGGHRRAELDEDDETVVE